MDYDVAIIGGGIHGVGVAQAAATRGYKTILLEQYGELAQGTSSRSSKLIHGGLRYLEQFEFSLVRECLLERSYLLKNAPDLVKLRPVYIPVYEHSKRPPWMIRAGLSLYALLGNLTSDTRFKNIPKHQWSEFENLNTENLLAVFQYFEAQTDDLLLTNAVMRSAQEYGAEFILHAKVSAINIQDQRCSLSYIFQEKIRETINAKVIINAAGPWAASLIGKVQPKQKSIPVDLVQGTHIVLPIQLGDPMYYLESPDDYRPLFVMPWYGDTMIGTTESLYKGEPNKTSPLNQEIEYLLRAFSHYFPGYKGPQLEVKHQFSGLRVLPSSNKKANKRSRDIIYLQDRKIKPRMISIFGGKLTAYRSTAEQVMHRLQDSLPKENILAETKNLKLIS